MATPLNLVPSPAGRSGGLCLETQSREIMAVLVHDVVADAMHLGLYDAAPAPVVKANGAHREGRRHRNQNG